MYYFYFKLVLNQANFFNKQYSYFQRLPFFGLTQPAINVFNKINVRENVTYISCFDFSSFYTKMPYAKFMKTLKNLTDCYVKEENEKLI